jgi:ABC-type transport system involved in multi-copper enzyme maturation permease subunit
MNSYGVQALLYATAGTGIQRGLSPDSILPAMLPPESVAVALRTFGPDLGFDGTVPFVLLGALVAGSSWSGGTVRTAFLQGPSRAHVVLGQVAALGFAFLAVTVATFTICVGASALAAMTTTQPSESIGPFPTTAAIGTGLGSALLVSICYGSIGFALGTLTRSASGAIGGALLWSITLQTNVTAMAGQLGGAARAIDGLLPFASVQTLTGLLNDSSTAVLPTPLHVQPSAAVLVLLTWLTASIAMCVLVSNARDIT